MQENNIDSDVLKNFGDLEKQGFSDVLGVLSLNISENLRGVLDLLVLMSEEIKSKIDDINDKNILEYIVVLEKEYKMSLLEISEFMSVICIHFWFRKLFKSSEKIYDAVIYYLIDKKVTIEEEILDIEDKLDNDVGNEKYKKDINQRESQIEGITHLLDVRKNIERSVEENKKICQSK